jgi:hypothetical protein
VAITTYKAGKAGLTAGIVGNGALDAHGPTNNTPRVLDDVSGRQGGALQEPQHLLRCDCHRGNLTLLCYTHAGRQQSPVMGNS